MALKLKPYEALRKKLPKETREQAEYEADQILQRLKLGKYREKQGVTQASVAEKMGMPQGNISRLEKQHDMKVSTLRKYIESIGGTLEIIVHLPDGKYQL